MDDVSKAGCKYWTMIRTRLTVYVWRHFVFPMFETQYPKVASSTLSSKAHQFCKVKHNMDEHVYWRAKVAYMYTISQMLIYNTYSTYHNTKTITIRNSKEHETPFLLYQGLNMHGDARLGGGGKGKTTTSGCHTGQHSMITVKHVPYFYTLAVQGLAQETVNVAELECIRGTGLCKCEGGCMNNDNT